MIMYKVKIQISSLNGVAELFVKCDASDINVFFDNTRLSYRELSQFVSPRTHARYGKFFVDGFVNCKVLKVTSF